MPPNQPEEPFSVSDLEVVVRDVEDALLKMTWVEDPLPVGAEANGILHLFSGSTPAVVGWSAVVLEFEAVDAAGAKAGVIGVDGSATNRAKGLIVRLPPRSASIAVGLARAALGLVQ